MFMFGSSGNHGKSDRRVKFGPEFNAVMVMETPIALDVGIKFRGGK
jgi:hypothetical protein